jgi:2-(3-amino-3-carboxypropyl)histidine synthase
MRLRLYDLELERVSSEIDRLKAQRVLLQLPDGLRPKAFKLAESLNERTGTEVLILGDSCYGACDIALRQGEALGADLLIHYGHSKMLSDSNLPILYVEARFDIDIDTVVDVAIPHIEGWRKIGLTSTVQHVHQLGELVESLARREIQAVIGESSGRVSHNGQVLGCDYETALSVLDEVDGFLFVGGGRFHPLGLALVTGKTVVAVDPYLSSASLISDDEVKRMAMRRMAAITLAKNANYFGIIVSYKLGQIDVVAAETIRNELARRGKKAVIICFDEVGGEALVNFSEADVFINTACPRLAIDGVGYVRRPILNVDEAYVMLGKLRWGEVWRGSHQE